MAAVIAILILSTVGMACTVALLRRTQRAEAALKTQQTKARVLLDSLNQRYQIKVTDWGDDFTGKGGVLPRWRWVITDADYSAKLALAPEFDPRQSPVRMLGNAYTKHDAYADALAWIEEQVHPVLVIDGRDL